MQAGHLVSLSYYDLVVSGNTTRVDVDCNYIRWYISTLHISYHTDVIIEMVFGFLTKKLSAAKAVLNPAQIPLPPSPLPGNSSLTSLHEVPEASSSSVRQLRTPSPSIDSVAPGPSSSYAASTRQLSEPSFLVTPIEPQLVQPALLPTAESLATLIKVVPPKTLRDYVVERLPSASTATLESLCDFFNTLSPPPRLHCVRCHKDFVEVENDDRSCTVAHDDDSAEVERVGRTGEARKTKEGTEYETLWGCCGKTTEGDGSQGPPDGWCYEGKHTVSNCLLPRRTFLP